MVSSQASPDSPDTLSWFGVEFCASVTPEVLSGLAEEAVEAQHAEVEAQRLTRRRGKNQEKKKRQKARRRLRREEEGAEGQGATLAREANRLAFCGVEFCGLGQEMLAGLVQGAVDAHREEEAPQPARAAPRVGALSFCGVEFCGLGQETLSGLVEGAVDAHSQQSAAALGEEELDGGDGEWVQVSSAAALKPHAMTKAKQTCDRDDSVATPPASPATFWAVPTMRPPSLRI